MHCLGQGKDPLFAQQQAGFETHCGRSFHFFWERTTSRAQHCKKKNQCHLTPLTLVVQVYRTYTSNDRVADSSLTVGEIFPAH